MANVRIRYLDDKGAIKNLFWKSLQGMSRTDAQRNYLATYHRLRRQLHDEDELPRIQVLIHCEPPRVPTGVAELGQDRRFLLRSNFSPGSSWRDSGFSIPPHD